MPEVCEAGVTANDDGGRPSLSKLGSYLYVVPHPLLPQTVLTVVTLLRDDGGGPWSRVRALGCQSVEMGGGVRVPVGVKGEV